jgi:AcrR family transcriptional regulator
MTRAASTGRPKGDKRARTRAKLIEAAGLEIGEKGYEGASLDAIAARAGMSRGAIYGNFANKEELLLAFVETRWTPAEPPALGRGAPLAEQLRIIGEAVAHAAQDRRSSAVGALSFQAYMLRHEAMRARFAEANERIYREMVEWLLAHVDESELPTPPDIFVRVLHALADGLTFACFAEPDQFTPEVFVAAFVALAGKTAR